MTDRTPQLPSLRTTVSESEPRHCDRLVFPLRTTQRQSLPPPHRATEELPQRFGPDGVEASRPTPQHRKSTRGQYPIHVPSLSAAQYETLGSTQCVLKINSPPHARTPHTHTTQTHTRTFSADLLTLNYCRHVSPTWHVFSTPQVLSTHRARGRASCTWRCCSRAHARCGRDTCRPRCGSRSARAAAPSGGAASPRPPAGNRNMTSATGTNC